jgi:hypothetical protein
MPPHPAAQVHQSEPAPILPWEFKKLYPTSKYIHKLKGNTMRLNSSGFNLVEGLLIIVA